MTAGAVENRPLVEVSGLSKCYDLRTGLAKVFSRQAGQVVRAVNNVNFRIRQGETLGLIGESGCGKTTLGRTLLRLHEPTAGTVIFDGQDLTELNADDLKKMRRRMQIIFQDPYASLNPRRTVGQIVGLPLQLHENLSDREVRDRVGQLLERIGLKSSHMQRYPHQFSGGQRQRIGIARALILNPEFVVCDEPVSALDVSIQAQIIELLEELKQELSLTYLFISHDLSVVGYLAKRVAVMYLGEIVEMGTVKGVLSQPSHPYTQALLSAVPRVDSAADHQRVKLSGDLPSSLNPPMGCKFHTRCPKAMEICRRQAPRAIQVDEDHQVACHLFADSKQ